MNLRKREKELKRREDAMCKKSSFLIFSFSPFFLLLLFVVFFTACSELETPKTEPFYAQNAPPPKQEFRWSNGKMPKSFDPALASAAPETDVVRALFEGLTDNDSKTLKTVPAIATEWNSSDDEKVWTFKLRRDAKWSNGKTVTAEDFVRSWKRLAVLNEKVAHRNLLRNIVGMPIEAEPEKNVLSDDKSVFFLNSLSGQNISPEKKSTPENTPIIKETNSANSNTLTVETEAKPQVEEKKETKFGVEAVSDFVLKVTLNNADKDFPSLVAHPIFRPVFGDGKEFEIGKLNADVVTNGAFRVVSVGQDGVTLDRAEHYWNKKEIELERVRFVPTENAEKALEAYRAGEIDAVTNANFEPLALKLLKPYDDFRWTTHSALNFYEFNRKTAPFNDRRVREALAISIQRERLTEGDMEGSTSPALTFLPFESNDLKLNQNIEKAKSLLDSAGFPDGEEFPTVRLLINRNDVQQKIARSVAKMWKQNLNIETEIIIKDSAELETLRQTGEFDIVRRGVVLPTTDETVNMLAILQPKNKTPKLTENKNTNSLESALQSNTQILPIEKESLLSKETTQQEEVVSDISENENGEILMSEEAAIIEFPAIPLYFPTSYSLVKPYVQGFEMNTLDAPSLKDVQIDNNWQPKTKKSES